MADAKQGAAPQATEQVLEKGLLDQIVEARPDGQGHGQGTRQRPGQGIRRAGA